MSSYLRGIWWGAWVISPIVVLLMLVLPGLVEDKNPSKWFVIAGTETVGTIVLLALWGGPVRWTAARALGAIIFITYLAYVVVEFRAGRFTSSGRSQPSVLNAMLGLVFYGGPGLILAIRGPRAFAEKAEKGGGDNPELDDRDDAIDDSHE